MHVRETIRHRARSQPQTMPLIGGTQFETRHSASFYFSSRADSGTSRSPLGEYTNNEQEEIWVWGGRKLGAYASHNEVRNELASICNDLNLHVEVGKGSPDGSLLRPTLLYFKMKYDDVFKILRLQAKSKAASKPFSNAVVVILFK